MDASEATKKVYSRISRLESEDAAKKIIEYIYFQGFTDQDMIRLALGPDILIHNLIQEVKSAHYSPQIPATMNSISLPHPPMQYIPCSQASPCLLPAPDTFPRLNFCCDPQLALQLPPTQNSPFQLIPYSADYTRLNDTIETIKSGPSNFPYGYYGREAALNNLSIRGVRNSRRPNDRSIKICQYFNKGLCKYGSNCRYVHGETSPERYPHTYSFDVVGEDQVVSPGTLEKLEFEITELLKSRGGHPVSIASLPMMYSEKYGRTLQAEGYLTESQRHGKAGYSLTKLLARLKNSIRLIDRPHGQHAVILAEDAPKYMEIRAEKNDPGPVVDGSQQIYLTFPVESTFTEEDVCNYFSKFGVVQDVRIPFQKERMFGFVTFDSADTVDLILSIDTPHFICESRVRVKQYRERPKDGQRKYHENFDNSVYYQTHPIDINRQIPADWESSRLMIQMQLMEEQQRALELEAMRLSQLQLTCKPVVSDSGLGFSLDELRVPTDQLRFPSPERFSHLFDVLNTSDVIPTCQVVNNIGDQERRAQELDLPDSTFTSAVGNNNYSQSQTNTQERL